MKKNMIKRIIGISMSIVLVAGVLPYSLGIGKVEADSGVTYEPAKVSANLIPAQAAANQQFMNAHVIQQTEKTAVYSTSAKFKVIDFKNIRKDTGIYYGKELSRNDLLMHDGNDHWYAKYQWDLTNYAVLKDLIKEGQISLHYDGYLASDHHSNGKNHWGKSWDRAIASMMAEGYPYLLMSEYSKAEQDEIGQHKQWSRALQKGHDVTSLYFEANHTGCNCGSSQVGRSVIWMTDTTAPKITNIYAAKNADGTEKVTATRGFKADETGYIVLEFSEYIRFFDNESESLALELDLFSTSNDQETNGEKVAANLVRLEGKKMIFKFVVPKKLDGADTNVYVPSIADTQTWAGQSSGAFKGCLIDEFGVTFTPSTLDLKGGSRISDLAGNPLDWGNSTKKLETTFFMDNVAPRLGSITLSGSMITKDSTVSKNEWTEDIDRSAVFAGIGDTLKFSVYFSEELDVQDISGISAKLNIKDKDGKQVAVKAESIKSVNAKLVQGVDSTSGNITRITFETLTMSEGMQPMSVDGDPIQITAISGLEGKKDLRGNALPSLDVLTMAAKQQEYLDVLAPKVETTMAQTEGTYTPVVHSGREFTIPITVEDDKSADDGKGAYASDVLGLNGSFSLLMEGDAKEFSWCVDSSQEKGKDSYYRLGKTAETIEGAEKYNLLQLNGSNTAYIHIRLDRDIDYNYAGGSVVNATLVVNGIDYAGNQVTKQYQLQHNADAEAAVVTLINYMTEAKANGQATITANLKAEDNFGISELSYYWGEDTTNPVKVELEADSMKSHEFTVTQDFSIATDDLRTGTKKITVVGKDVGGNPFSFTQELSYDLSRPTGSYEINTGTKEAPISEPKVSILRPYGSGAKSRTVLFIETGVMEGAEKEYYAIATFDSSNYPTSSYNIFNRIPTASGSSAESYYYGNSWYRVVGSIDETNKSGTFTSAEQLTDTQVYKVGQLIKDHYGTRNFVFVTTNDFYQTKENLLENKFSFTGAMTSIEKKVVYLVNDPTFSVTVSDIRNAEGTSILSELKYEDGKGTRPVANLDEAVVHFNITNQSDAASDTIFGKSAIDFDRSTYAFYCGSLYNAHRGSLEELMSQTITIPEGFTKEEGYYKLKLELRGIDGTYRTVESEAFFVFPEAEGVELSQYNKTMVRLEGNTWRKNLHVRADSKIGNELTIGLAENPKGWTTSSSDHKDAKHELVFTRNATSSDVVKTSNVQIKVWSDKDPSGEKNAPWIDFSSVTEMRYTPVLVSEFTESVYENTNSVLPLVEGDNIVSYQVRNTNGTIETHEILIHVSTDAPKFALHVETEPRKATISADVLSQGALSGLTFEAVNRAEEAPDELNGLKKYTVDYSGTCEFVLYDESGNMTSQTCEITDVDGIAPYCNTIETEDSSDIGVNGDGFHFTFYASDGVAISPDDITLTFDKDYSALLMGLEGEARANNTEQITMKLPVNMEKDEEGNYQIWQEFSSKNYGIYRTEIIKMNEATENEQAGYTVEIWGAFKYDPSVTDENASIERTLTLTAYDESGNSYIHERTKSYANKKPAVVVGAKDPWSGHLMYSSVALDENGELGVYSLTPIQSIDCFGADELQFDEYLEYMSAVYTSLPMITADGTYEIIFTDLFGTIYSEELVVQNAFSNFDVEFKVSETGKTNQDVIVTAVAKDGAVLKAISGTIGEKNVAGSVDELSSYTGSVVMTENGTVTALVGVTEEEWSEEKQEYVSIVVDKSYTFKVRNIDKTIEPVTVVFQYNGASEPEFVSGTTDTVEGVVKAIVVCGEELDGTNGKLSYEFPKGSKKGEKYTFEYQDMAGNTGKVTAELPYHIAEAKEEIPEVDKTAPVYTLNLLGKRNEEFTYLSEHKNLADGSELGAVFQGYIAQGYQFRFMIEDHSKTKLIVRESGSAEPSSYAAESTSITGVTVTGTTITVTENAAFDLYIVDEAGNVTALKGIDIQTVDKKAPEVLVHSSARKGEDGVTNIIRAIYYPENDELIYPYNSDVCAMPETVQGEDYVAYEIMRYYQDYAENGIHTFYYKDAYGNTGTAKVEIAGLDNAPPVIQSVAWYGTEENKVPTESKAVNHDVTVELNVNKAIQGVKIYEHDPAAEHEKGAEMNAADIGIRIEFTGKVAHIIFTEPTQKSYVAEVIANNDKTDSEVLPIVACIDKTGPVVSDLTEELSADHTYKTFTFTTNEAAENKESVSNTEKTSHEWIVRKNGVYELVFTDQAGNRTTKEVTVTGIDEVLLTLSYSKNADGSEATDDALNLGVAAGETFYVKTNKDAKIVWNDTETSVSADIWTAFTVGNESGYYAVKAIDQVTGRIVYGNVGAQLKDSVAPLIQFDEKTVYLKDDSSMKELVTALKSGVTVTDNRDKEAPAFQYNGVPLSVKAGIYLIKYTATDSAGNEGEATRVLYIYSGDKLILKVNGSPVEPYGTKIVSGKTVNLELETEAKGPVVIRWKEGIKTTGQMKYNSKKVDSTGILKLNNSGFYTIYVRTQNRAEVIFYLFIEE